MAAPSHSELPFSSPQQIQTVSDNSARSADDIRYNPDAIHWWFPGMTDVAEAELNQTLIAKQSFKALKKSVLRWSSPSRICRNRCEQPNKQRMTLKFQ